MKRILILEPYYGGSHKLFLKGLQDTVPAEYTLLTLPARKWKMRMQLSALWFAEQISQLLVMKEKFDTVLCSTFVDVAVLRSLLLAVPGWCDETRFCTYFHENQFVYPIQKKGTDHYQFTAINFNTALASDSCAFNSHYNLESFLSGIQTYLKNTADMKLAEPVSVIREKSIVLYPGMDYTFLEQSKTEKKSVYPPVIVWNHRWEHDKGPEIFFDALYQLQAQGIAFRLMVLGQSFASLPSCFQEARVRLQKEIIHFGFADTLAQYGTLLKQGDIVVSTARHEFFGISVLEGIRAGCYPLLPNDLSYPELYSKKFLYEPEDLASRLKRLLIQPEPLTKAERNRLTIKFSWEQCGEQYGRWLFDGE